MSVYDEMQAYLDTKVEELKIKQAEEIVALRADVAERIELAQKNEILEAIGNLDGRLSRIDGRLSAIDGKLPDEDDED